MDCPGPVLRPRNRRRRRCSRTTRCKRWTGVYRNTGGRTPPLRTDPRPRRADRFAGVSEPEFRELEARVEDLDSRVKTLREEHAVAVERLNALKGRRESGFP